MQTLLSFPPVMFVAVLCAFTALAWIAAGVERVAGAVRRATRQRHKVQPIIED